MKREVITYNAIEGFHRYPDAPKEVQYLADKHRHIFVIHCKFGVTHNEREVEIIQAQSLIADLLESRFGKPCDFGALSCESIAELIMDEFPEITNVEVLEDGYGGASLTR